MVKITRLEVENLKRVKAVALEPSESGLTIIGGRNGQGKTSVLDAIAWALGGEKYRPSEPHRADSVLPPEIHVTLSNGLTVERKGKNGALKVTDPSGRRSGQQLLDGLIEKLALDLPRFMRASEKDKAETLLKVIGVGDQLRQLEAEESRVYSERTAVGRIADQKMKYAQELPQYPGVPADLVSPLELIQQQQEILLRNAENARKRNRVTELDAERTRQVAEVARLTEAMREATERLAQISDDLRVAKMDASALQDESTEALEESIRDVDEINRKVRANLDRDKALEDARRQAEEYTALTAQIDGIRARRRALLEGAKLPLPGLSVQGGQLTYQGHPWDGMSGSEQLRVATAIVRALNPECGFVLADKLEQLDPETLKDFGAWLEAEGLQVIATRVSTGGECSIIISDGEVVPPPPPAWKEGEF